MGWGSGSSLFSDIIRVVKKEVPDQTVRERIYFELISSFEDGDWDTQDECIGEDVAYDYALRRLHPEWDHDD